MSSNVYNAAAIFRAAHAEGKRRVERCHLRESEHVV